MPEVANVRGTELRWPIECNRENNLVDWPPLEAGQRR
jgi:hypothetical protein